MTPVAEEVRAEREAQGLEPKIRNERALLQVARLVNEPTRPPAPSPAGRPESQEADRGPRRGAA